MILGFVTSTHLDLTAVSSPTVVDHEEHLTELSSITPQSIAGDINELNDCNSLVYAVYYSKKLTVNVD